MVKNKEIFDAYVYVCSECECLYGCNVPTKDAGRVRKDCRKCDEKYGCVHRLVYKLGRDDENIKPEWSGQNQEGIIIKSDNGTQSISSKLWIGFKCGVWPTALPVAAIFLGSSTLRHAGESALGFAAKPATNPGITAQS